MSVGYELATLTIDFLEGLKLPTSEWYLQKIEELSDIKRKDRTQKAELEQELQMLKVRFAAEIERKKEEEQRATNDYKEFLDSIGEMKQKMLATFPDMPKSIVYSIHHHAKYLLDEIWKSSDEASQVKSRSRFADFLMAVYNDTANALVSEQELKLPKETLKLIKGSASFEINLEDRLTNSIVSEEVTKSKTTHTIRFHFLVKHFLLPLLVLKEIFFYPFRDSMITSSNSNHKVVRG